MGGSLDDFNQAETEWNLKKLHDDLANAKAEFSPHRKKELTSTEMLHLRGLLSGKSPSEIAKRLFVRPQGLNVTLSNTLYRYVEALTQRPTRSIKNWREVADWLEAAGYKNCTAIDWNEAPDVPTFYGREQEFAQLKQWVLHEHTRLVALLGMGGIGKTALSVKLVEQIKDQFEWVVWRSVRSEPPLEKLLSELLPNLAPEPELNVDASQVMGYLRAHRCLIVLDEIEGLLANYPVGHYRLGYEAYGEFFRRIGTERHRSCVLLISREKPKEILLLEEKKSLICSMQLGGLLGEAAQKILQDKKLLDENHQWQKVIQLYGGNPLALKVVAETIKDLFSGSINRFLKEQTTFIDTELCAILDQQFMRLSKPEIEVVRQLAIHYQPLPISSLRQTIGAIDSCIDSLQVIEALRRRSLLEKVKSCHEDLFTLHPIVLKYAKRMYVYK
jgi:hypothetical protein